MKRLTDLRAIMSLAIIFTALYASAGSAQTVWAPDKGNPVLRAGPDSWDSTHVFMIGRYRSPDTCTR